MVITVLVDNNAMEGLQPEWGLSVHIVSGSLRILLDTGASGIFAENADCLGIDLNAVDLAVLSHAHYDHSDGLAKFFARNDHAPCFLRAGAAEDCWSRHENGMKYIGIRHGLLEGREDRLRYVSGNFSPAEGIWLIPHRPGTGEAAGRRAGMFRERGGRMVVDDFSHEQSLVLESEKGLVIFSSCSHTGPDSILSEISEAFPGRPLLAMIGGFHLFRTPDDEVRALADRLRRTGIQKLVTGHCTGDRAFGILHELLGDRVIPMAAGLQMEPDR